MIYFLYFKFQSENGAVKFVDYMQTRSRITFETRRRICTQNAKASKVIVWSEPPIPNFSLFFFSISRKFQQNFCTIYFHAIFCACNFREITKTIYFSYFLQAPIEKRPKYFINKWTAEYAKLFFFIKKDHLQEQVYLLGHIVMLSPQWVTKRTSRALTLMDSVSLEAITVKFVLVLTQIVNKFSSRVSCFNRLDKWKNWNVSWRPEV